MKNLLIQALFTGLFLAQSLDIITAIGVLIGSITAIAGTIIAAFTLYIEYRKWKEKKANH